MGDLIQVQGMVISAQPVGEYDKRIVLLTRERGKISAFAKGARRQGSPLMAAANPLVFGRFSLYEGRTSYNVSQISITHHFVELAQMQPQIYYAYYFLELADYFGHEGTDEREMMNLLFVTVKALMRGQMENKLIRCVFELRAMSEEGMCPALFECASCGREITGNEERIFFSQEEHGVLCPSCSRQHTKIRPVAPSVLYAMQYIVRMPLSRLYGFTLKPEALSELESHVHTYVDRNTDRRFKTLQILEVMDS